VTPIYKNNTYWSITEPWVPNHKQPLEANNVSLWKANLPQIRKVEAIVDNKLELVLQTQIVYHQKILFQKKIHTSHMQEIRVLSVGILMNHNIENMVVL
jgi:hypothetical protein